jgi:methyl-accepting chemotaxis protein
MESWMPFFVVVIALAVVLQAIMVIVLFLQLRRTAARIEQTVADLNVRLSPIISRVQFLVEDVSPRILGIVSDISEFSRLARGQAQKVDRVLTETMERLRLQLIHVDQILTGVMEAVEQTGVRIKQTIRGPVVQASALIRGIQTGLEFFRNSRQRREPTESQSEHHDEGMFI